MLFFFAPPLLQPIVFASLFFLILVSTFILLYLQIGFLCFATLSHIADWTDPSQYNYWNKKCYPQYLLAQCGHFIKLQIFCKIVDFPNSKSFLLLRLGIFQVWWFHRFYRLVFCFANCRSQQMSQCTSLVFVFNLIVVNPQL